MTSATASAVVGGTITDSATISGLLGTPTGNIVFTLYGPSASPVCTTAIYTSAPVAVTGDGTYNNPTPQTVNTGGSYYWIAAFTDTDGGNLDASTPCGDNNETSVVVQPDANIAITPATATDPVNDMHTLTGHVNVSDDSVTYTNAPAGTLITFSIVSGPGSFVGGVNTCTTIGTTGECTVQITSAVGGTTVVHATTTLTVNTVSLTRSTGDSNVGDSADAQKVWVQPDANIAITPATATDPVNDMHTLTGHVNVSDDSVTYTNAPAGTLITFSIVSGPGSFVGGVNTCTTIGTTGECTVQITSAVGGTTVVHATTTLTVNTVSLTRSTGDSNVGDSADAQKVWVNPDANIQISPATADNPTNTNHTLTGHVNVSDDSVTYTNAPAGTLITFSIVSGPGSFVGGVNTCTTIGTTGSCTVQITSSVGGTTVIRATTTLTVNTVSLTRTTNDGLTGDSVDAHKTWHPPVTGGIFPTQTSCTDFTSGTATLLPGINYVVNGGKIGQNINPGVFFYFSTVTTTTVDQVVTTSQTTDNSSGALFQVNQGHAWLWTSNCVSKIVGTLQNNGATASFVVHTPGTYIIQIQYQTKSLAGTAAPSPINPTYTFDTDGVDNGTIQLFKH